MSEQHTSQVDDGDEDGLTLMPPDLAMILSAVILAGVVMTPEAKLRSVEENAQIALQHAIALIGLIEGLRSLPADLKNQSREVT